MTDASAESQPDRHTHPVYRSWGPLAMTQVHGRHAHFHLAGISRCHRWAVRLPVCGCWAHPASAVVTVGRLEGLCAGTSLALVHHFCPLHPRTDWHRGHCPCLGMTWQAVNGQKGKEEQKVGRVMQLKGGRWWLGSVSEGSTHVAGATDDILNPGQLSAHTASVMVSRPEHMLVDWPLYLWCCSNTNCGVRVLSSQINSHTWGGHTGIWKTMFDKKGDNCVGTTV